MSLSAITRQLIVLASLLLANTAVAANLSGIVFGDSTPLQGAQVNLYDQSGTSILSQETDASGAYQFSSLAAGTYFVNVDPPENSPYESSSLRQVDISIEDVSLDFVLVAPAWTLSGYIRDREGRPIDGLGLL
ncbi:MAG: carboxypeptidase regulatory-like domain-containing protein, partial [Gammaproteobacteria bacterium]